MRWEISPTIKQHTARVKHKGCKLSTWICVSSGHSGRCLSAYSSDAICYCECKTSHLHLEFCHIWRCVSGLKKRDKKKRMFSPLNPFLVSARRFKWDILPLVWACARVISEQRVCRSRWYSRQHLTGGEGASRLFSCHWCNSHLSLWAQHRLTLQRRRVRLSRSTDQNMNGLFSVNWSRMKCDLIGEVGL